MQFRCFKPERNRLHRRRGVASVLAMLYLILFSVLAVGFYASVTTSVQVAANERRSTDAMLAANSGMEFMRYQMGQFVVPGSTTQIQLLPLVASQLAAQMNGTGNMGTMTVGTVSANSVKIPSLASQYIPLDSAGTGVRADLWQLNDLIVVKVTGREASGGAARPVQLNFHVAQTPGTIFNYGMATNGALSLSGGVLKGIPDASRGSFLSTTTGTNTPLSMSGSAVVSGEVYFTNPLGSVSGSGSISGKTTSAQWTPYIHKGVAPPEFPTVDPQPYVDYMNTVSMTVITGSTSTTPLSNIRIKAGVNPTFSGGGTIKGLIYIETPNKVTFSGGTNMTGVIVVDNPNEATPTNAIIFSGGGVMQGPENLDSSYGTLRTMTGASILAPNFAVTLTGGSATFGGSVLAKSVSLSGGSGGSVNGSVISYGTASTTFSGGSGFTFTNVGPASIPTAGVRFSGYFLPVQDSYLEPVP